MKGELFVFLWVFSFIIITFAAQKARSRAGKQNNDINIIHLLR